jgi:hypothetical protein
MGVLALATGAYAFLVGPVLRFLLTGGTSALGRVGAWAPALEAESRGRLLVWLPLFLVLIAVVRASPTRLSSPGWVSSASEPSPPCAGRCSTPSSAYRRCSSGGG